MTTEYSLYLYFCLVGFLVSLLLMVFAKPLANLLHLIDAPGGRKTHDRPIPLTGGLIFIGAFALVMVAHGLILAHMIQTGGFAASTELSKFLTALSGITGRIVALVVSGCLVFALGVVDDFIRPGPLVRLVVEFGAAALAVLGGVQPVFEGVPYWVGASVAIVWIVGIINAYNMVDGLDGLAAGLGIVAALLLGICLQQASQPQGVIVVVALAGCVGGFLVYNFHPARVFMGSSGAMTLGHILGTMTLYMGSLRGALVDVQAICVPLLIMAMPLYDICSVVYLRLVYRVPIMQGDRNHLHHRLLRMGFSQRQATAFIWLLAWIAGLPVVFFMYLDRILSLAVLGQIIAMCLALILIERAYTRLVSGTPSTSKTQVPVDKLNP